MAVAICVTVVENKQKKMSSAGALIIRIGFWGFLAISIVDNIPQTLFQFLGLL